MKRKMLLIMSAALWLAAPVNAVVAGENAETIVEEAEVTEEITAATSAASDGTAVDSDAIKTEVETATASETKTKAAADSETIDTQVVSEDAVELTKSALEDSTEFTESVKEDAENFLGSALEDPDTDETEKMTVEVETGLNATSEADAEIENETESDIDENTVIASGEYGSNLTWIVYTDGTLSISGEGDMDESASSQPWADYVSSITSIAVESGVTSICSSAFSESSSVTAVSIADSVTTIGNMAFSYCYALENIALPSRLKSLGDYCFWYCSSLTEIELPSRITSIGTYTFYGCSSLTDIIIPGNVTSIGNWAFYRCSALTSVTFSEGLQSIGGYAFYGCTGLSEIIIPEGVTSLEMYAFTNCTGLSSVTLPDSLVYMGDGLFSGCANLSEITIPDNVTSIGSNAFYGCAKITELVIPDSVTSLGNYAFYGCNSLESVTLSSNLTRIYSYTFTNCSSLLSVDIPGNVTSIGESAFSGCTALSSVVLRNKVQSIGESAFYHCTSLSSITLPSSVTSISAYAFEGCTGLTEIYFEGSVPAIGTEIFWDVTATVYYPVNNSSWTSDTQLDYGGTLTWVAYGETESEDESESDSEIVDSGTCGDNLTWKLDVDGLLTIGGYGLMTAYDTSSNIAPWFSDRTSILSVKIESGVTSIGSYAFYSCINIESVSIPNSVTSIGAGAFYNCLSLTEIMIPVGVSTIGSSAFYNCGSLVSATIPDGVTTLATYTFYGCKKLVSVDLPDSLESIGSYAFYNCTGLSEIDISENVATIGSYAFTNCSSLTSITIPDGVTAIQNYTFSGCSSLQSIDISSNLTYIGYEAFYGCCGLVSVNLPDGITSIGSWAFAGCTSLTSINIPKYLRTISSYVFSNCSSLTSIVIPEGVVTISSSAFSSCSSLAEVTISNGVVTISNAFGNCGSLKAITYTGTMAQWNMVETSSDLTYRPIHCTDGTISCDITDHANISVSSTDRTYNGTPRTPEVTVNIAGLYTLESGTDYTVTYDNNVDAGTATVTVTGTGDFTGSKTANFTINTLYIGNCEITVSADAVTYDGTPQTPSVTISCGGITLTEGTDYSLTYSNNTGIGQASIRIAGLGSVYGTSWVYFTIEEAAAVEGLAILSHPADCACVVGSKATFTVEAQGTDLTYQWQFSDDNGATWTDSTSASGVTSTYTLTMTAARDGRMVRCIVTDASGDSVTSKTASMILETETKLAIVTQPADYYGAVGTKASFSIEVEGTDLSYRWQYSDDNGATWVNSTLLCASTANYSLTMTSSRNGRKVRCIVTDASGNRVISDAATMALKSSITITSQPSEYIGAVGSKAVFAIRAEGDNLSYKWQYSDDDGTTWVNSTATSATLQEYTMTMTAARNGRRVRCIVSDASGNRVISDEAVMYIGEASITILSQPEDYVGAAGAKATFSVYADGEGLSYQWQYCDSSNLWINSTSASGRSTEYSMTLTAARSGRKVRCIVTDSDGNCVVSNEVRMTVG